MFNGTQNLCNSLGEVRDLVLNILVARVATPEQREALWKSAQFEIFRDFYHMSDRLSQLTSDFDALNKELVGIFSGMEGRAKTLIDAMYVGDGVKQAKDIVGRNVWSVYQTLENLLRMAADKGKPISFDRNTLYHRENERTAPMKAESPSV